MAKKAWYARTTWTESDREEVLERLRGTVGEHEQAACLRKQAGHLLTHAGKLARLGDRPGETDQLLAGARELFETFLSWFPDSSDRAYVLANLGEVEERGGRIEAALDRYREALAAQDGTTRSTSAHLRFGFLVCDLALVVHYAEALALVERHGQPLIYPVEQYRHCGIRAITLMQVGDRALAQLCAADALSATRHTAVDDTTRFHRALISISEGRRPETNTPNAP